MNAHIQQVCNVQVSHRNVWNNGAPPFVSSNHPSPLSKQQQQQQHFGRVQQAPNNKKHIPKTEWCRNILQGKICRYGSNCTFAHSEAELHKYTNPHEMAAYDSRIDPDTYFPMKSRCTSLHDPRLEGPVSSWLEQCKNPKKKSECAIPDPLIHFNEVSRFQTNPIISSLQWKQFGDDANAFAASYNLACNLDVSIMPNTNDNQPVKIIDEVYKLAIARDMQAKATSSDRNFIYSNQHCLYSQACLVLKTRYYRVINLQTCFDINIEHIVREVSQQEYNSRDPMMIKADEVVFDSKGKSECNHSIWFNVGFVKSTSWKNKQQDSKEVQNCKTLFCLPRTNDLFKAMVHAAEPPMMLMQSKDECKDGHQLIDSIWKHRIGWILSSRGNNCNWTDNYDELNEDFARLQKIVERDLWPTLTKAQVNKVFEEKSREEHTSTYYDPNFDSEDIASLWNSFVGELNGEHQTKPRLNVFESISSKDSNVLSKDLPHITNSSTTFISKHSKDTWEELLLGFDGEWTRALANHHSTKTES
eukprot:scaffold118047_cov35-Cyclotella_meneghiniana.AAC.1